MGRENRIYQFATVGDATPAFAYQGEPTTLTIGDGNVIREGVTIHRGTVQDQGETIIGSHNLLMAYVHVGHDCVLRDHIVMANNATLGGHVHVGNWANLGGFAAVPQYRSIGAYTHIGAMSLVVKDVPAYMSAAGNPARASGLNREGMRRREFDAETVAAITEAYRTVYRRGLTVNEALAALEPLAAKSPAVKHFVESISTSQWGIVRPRARQDGDGA